MEGGEIKMQNSRKSYGFTLIELLVVIAIIGILAAVVLVSLNSARAKSRDARRLSDVHQVQTAMELYYNDCGGYPGGTVTLGAAGQQLFSGGAACAGGGFSTATASGTVYAGQVPANPTPGGANYVYTQTGSGTGYTLTFTLEGPSGGLASGAHTADPSGIR